MDPNWTFGAGHRHGDERRLDCRSRVAGEGGGSGCSSTHQFDVAHTLLGYATHHASAIFWAVPFEAWLALRPPRTPADLLRNACAMSAIAAAVDYGVTPKRLTPGWELVVSKNSMVATYGAMALGLAAGALVARTWLVPTSRTS
jgi:hypothetical protein